MIAAPERMGMASSTRIAVMKSDQIDSGILNQVIPGARRFTTVVM